VPNEYSRQWFEVFLETMPPAWTRTEVEGVIRRLPLPDYRRVLDVCCGPGRHAGYLVRAGYDVTGIDRDATALERARAGVPSGMFFELDQRDLSRLDAEFDAALILWQSFGYFTSAENDKVLRDIAGVMRPGGRLLLDVYNPAYFARHQGRFTQVRDPRCSAITNHLTGQRSTTTIEYVDGSEESMEWELFDPNELSARAASAEFIEVERCTWWDESREPSSEEQRYQIVFQKRWTRRRHPDVPGEMRSIV
jgi:SAM-dependent methyltransferase